MFRLGAGERVRRAAQFLAAGAVILHFAGLIAQTASSGALPLSGLGPALSSLAFFVGLLAVAVVGLTGEPSMLLPTLPVAVALLGGALLAGFGSLTPSSVAGSGWFLLHTALSLLGLALLAVAVASSVLYLLQHRALKERRFGVIFQFVPPLEQLDRLNRLALAGGFPALTVGIALAVGSALDSVGPAGPHPAHIVWGLVSWAALGLVAAFRVAGRLQGRRAAYATAGLVVGIAVAYLVLTAVFGTGAGRFL